MNDVKEICDLTLDAAAPPLRSADDALALAKRTTRRRSRFAAAGSALAVVAAAGAMALPTLAGTAATSAAVNTSGAPAAVLPAAAVPLVPAPRVPTRQQAQDHGKTIASILLAAVPAGYHGAPEWTFSGGTNTGTWIWEKHPEQYGSTTSIVVSSGQRQGMLFAAIINDGVAAPTGDLCGAAVSKRVDGYFGAGRTCAVETLNGVPVRVSTFTDPDLGSVVLAVRMLDGGMLGVESSQGRWHVDSSNSNLPPDAKRSPGVGEPAAPKLATPALTPDQVAAIAANPALLP